MNKPKTTGNKKPKPKQPARKKPTKQRKAQSISTTPFAAQYLKTVLAPCSGNARIPDLNCNATTLLTLQNELTFTTSAGGVGGFYLQLGMVLGYAGETVASTTDAAITYDAITNMTGYNQLATDCEAWRIVSACIDVTYTGTALANSGVITGYTITRFGDRIDALPISAAIARSSRSNQTDRFSEGIATYYRPGDSATHFQFRAPGTGFNVGFLGVHISGAAALAPFFVTATVNLEAVPIIDTYSLMNAATSSSPIDILGTAKAVELVQKAPVFNTVEKARSLDDRLKSAPDTLNAVWNTARSVYSGAQLAAKIGTAASKLFF